MLISFREAVQYIEISIKPRIKKLPSLTLSLISLSSGVVSVFLKKFLISFLYHPKVDCLATLYPSVFEVMSFYPSSCLVFQVMTDDLCCGSLITPTMVVFPPYHTDVAPHFFMGFF